MGVTGIRGGGALARRNAGFGAGAGGVLLARSEFSRTAAGAGTGCGFGFGSATMAGLFRRVSSEAGAASWFFGLREGVTVLVK
jgi:hypothetical protein